MGVDISFCTNFLEDIDFEEDTDLEEVLTQLADREVQEVVDIVQLPHWGIGNMEPELVVPDKIYP